MAEQDRMDAIVVGAGPAGITAAKELANAGLATVVLERGQFPGAKNVWGGILYRQPTESFVPGFEEVAPLERRSSNSATLSSPRMRCSAP